MSSPLMFMRLHESHEGFYSNISHEDYPGKMLGAKEREEEFVSINGWMHYMPRNGMFFVESLTGDEIKNSYLSNRCHQFRLMSAGEVEL